MSPSSPQDDFLNLQEITLGDYPIEIELLKIFMSTTEESILTLQKEITSEPEQWRSLCHAFKGACFNIGANHLGKMVENLMTLKTAPAQTKKVQLIAVAQHYEALKEIILKRIETLHTTLNTPPR